MMNSRSDIHARLAASLRAARKSNNLSLDAVSRLKPDVENFQNLGAPMHPGAEAYYREQGLWPEG